MIAGGLLRPGQQGAGFVVLTPHHRRRAGNAVLFQIGEEQVFLARIMLLHVRQQPQLGGRLVPEIRGGGQLPEPGGDPGQLVVLLEEGVDRVSRHRLPGPALIDGALEHRGVHVAELQDLLLGQPLRDQFLLHLDHYVVWHLPQQRGQPALHRLGGLAFVKLEDEVLQQFLALFRVVDQFAHG